MPTTIARKGSADFLDPLLGCGLIPPGAILRHWPAKSVVPVKQVARLLPASGLIAANGERAASS